MVKNEFDYTKLKGRLNELGERNNPTIFACLKYELSLRGDNAKLHSKNSFNSILGASLEDLVFVNPIAELRKQSLKEKAKREENYGEVEMHVWQNHGDDYFLLKENGASYFYGIYSDKKNSFFPNNKYSNPPFSKYNGDLDKDLMGFFYTWCEIFSKTSLGEESLLLLDNSSISPYVGFNLDRLESSLSEGLDYYRKEDDDFLKKVAYGRFSRLNQNFIAKNFTNPFNKGSSTKSLGLFLPLNLKKISGSAEELSDFYLKLKRHYNKELNYKNYYQLKNEYISALNSLKKKVSYKDFLKLKFKYLFNRKKEDKL